MTDASTMPFSIGETQIMARGRARRAMVITPKGRVVVDAQRLERMRGATTLSPVERWLVDEVRGRGDDVRVVLFRAVDATGLRVWQFDGGFSDEELREGGVVVTRALLPLHRAFLRRGIVLMVHTDWGLRECHAMRHGLRTVRDGLRGSGDPDAIATVDQWILENMLMHVALSLDHVVTSLLPAHTTMLDRRLARVREFANLLGDSA